MTSTFTSTTSIPALCLILGLLLAMGSMFPGAEARALFVFGDSLVDSGNNNYLATSARADMPPYGVDYPTQRPTGRFSNGYNIPDFLSQQLGSNEAPLPYLDPAYNGQKLLVGANFASAGIGILNDTGIQFKLYDLGARKVLVTGTGPLGCVPSELAQRGRNGQCAPDLQQAAALFNPQLVQMLNGLNSRLGNVFIAEIQLILNALKRVVTARITENKSQLLRAYILLSRNLQFLCCPQRAVEASVHLRRGWPTSGKGGGRRKAKWGYGADQENGRTDENYSGGIIFQTNAG